jgi:hypothetical protein
MATPHYVYVDVTSDEIVDGTTYYTRHSNMAAPHYVCADVSSDYIVD